ncbi:hypothetical protein Nepgr_007292 [Nepenthes gracilis]|uniref:Uncharacterized protein n=1 Tax=Nepenthes gracilis TaxID=150966 RepID=A0AAD3S6K5_NEPGR|nr:hypothetical protein Nepgr_007292 [Nepenthes gracilis]
MDSLTSPAAAANTSCSRPLAQNDQPNFCGKLPYMLLPRPCVHDGENVAPEREKSDDEIDKDALKPIKEMALDSESRLSLIKMSQIRHAKIGESWRH